MIRIDVRVVHDGWTAKHARRGLCSVAEARKRTTQTNLLL